MTIPFSALIQQKALERQRFRCASCKAAIASPGRSGASAHRFGEGAEAHHLIPHLKGGPNTIDNCVILCRSCHLSAHQGGRWRDVTIYADLRGSMADKIKAVAALYPHYRG